MGSKPYSQENSGREGARDMGPGGQGSDKNMVNEI